MTALARYLFLLLLPALLLAWGDVCPAAAELSGSAEWQWVEYTHEVEGRETQKDSHFYQQYSLLYQTEGSFNHGRAGSWTANLGYEWNALAAKHMDEETEVDTGKILYRGELLFAPGGLPLRVHAFSYDLYRSRPSGGFYDTDNLIDPGVYSEILNGQHITTGITVVAGIRNGSYLGQYRDLLAKFPRLFIDYRQDDVRDDKRENEVHYRKRDLAFVSLNKKDNWFHYRYADYEDFLHPEDNYVQKQYMLGTIDHMQRRQWIHLTNWIQISVDGSLTIVENPQLEGTDSKETYLLNAFTVARRSAWEFSNFTTMVRQVTAGGGREQAFSFPLFARGRLDPQSTWRAQFLGLKEVEEHPTITSLNRNEEDAYGQAQLETMRQPGFVLTPEVELEARRGDRGEGDAARFTLELRTDERYQKPLAWLVGYSVAYFSGEDQVGQPTSFWEQVVRGSVDYRLNSTTRMGASQEFRLGIGEYHGGITEHISAASAERLSDSNAEDYDLDGTVWRSITSGYYDIIGRKKLHNRFSALLDYADTGIDRQHRLELRHILTYDTRDVYVRMRNLLMEGDELHEVGGVSEELGTLYSTVGVVDKAFNHETKVNYQPNRFWKISGLLTYDWLSGSTGDGQMLELEQEARYSVFRVGGLARRWVEFSQGFDYEQVWSEGSAWYTAVDFGVDYYPTYTTALGADVTLHHFGASGQTQVGFGLYAALRYPKFETRATYRYAQREEGDFMPQIKDQRWELNVRKLF